MSHYRKNQCSYDTAVSWKLRRRRFYVPPAKLDVQRQLRVQACDLAPRITPTPTKYLHVQTDYFTAQSIWKKIGGVWSCVKADPVLKWMVGMSTDNAKLALIKMNATYNFL